MKTEDQSWRSLKGGFGIRGGLLMLSLAAAGCGGGSSSSDGAVEAFLGHWEIEGTTSSFTINCPNTVGSGTFPIWTELILDHGVLTDLTDISTACVAPGINYDLDSKGVVATAADPDPYTNSSPECRWVLGPDQNGLPIYVDFTFSSLTITKLQSSGSGTAPRVLFGGSASGPLVMDDGTGTGTSVTSDTCTYSGAGDIFHRTTQP